MYKNDNDNSSPDIYSTEMLKELDKRSKNIRFAITRMDVDIEKASINLYWIYITKAYKAMGHENIIDYALAEFDISKSTTYNYITLAERFGHRDEDDNLLFDGFDEKYKSYSSSKLNLLAPFTDDEINYLDISPEMSFREIKKKIKSAEDLFEVYCLNPEFKKSQEKISTDKLDNNSKSITENSNRNDAPEDDDNKSMDDSVSAPDNPEMKSKVINDDDYCDFPCYVDIIEFHQGKWKIVDTVRWNHFNIKFLCNSLKHNYKKSFLIRSVESESVAFYKDS